MVLPDKRNREKKGNQSAPAVVCEQLERLTLSLESEAECPECDLIYGENDSVCCLWSLEGF